MEELQIRATVDGVVEAVELQPGDLVAANAPVLSLMDTGRLWIRAYIPQQFLGMDVGSQVRVSVDGIPDQEFAGRVTFLARQAEFTPRNVQTPEERAKQVFRAKIELVEPGPKLRPGMTVDVWLDQE
jgi:multidrug resistance efflux pump